MGHHNAEPRQLQQQLDEALNALTDAIRADQKRQVRSILFANLDRGRLKYYVDGGAGSVTDYVHQVAQTFGKLSPYLHQLQIERSSEAWAPLFERMQIWAYNFFLRKNFAADESTREIAVECASNAAMTLLNAYFPYDTDFDAWAHIIVQNACRKYIGRGFKKSVVSDDKQVELDENIVTPNDVLLEIRALRRETKDELEQALAQLSEARRMVIRCVYIDEMEPEEIARQMGKSVGAIYSLQFNALQDLRKILSRIRDNLNE